MQLERNHDMWRRRGWRTDRLTHVVDSNDQDKTDDLKRGMSDKTMNEDEMRDTAAMFLCQ